VHHSSISGKKNIPGNRRGPDAEVNSSGTPGTVSHIRRVYECVMFVCFILKANSMYPAACPSIRTSLSHTYTKQRIAAGCGLLVMGEVLCHALVWFTCT